MIFYLTKLDMFYFQKVIVKAKASERWLRGQSICCSCRELSLVPSTHMLALDCR